MCRFPSGLRCRHAASQIHPYLWDAHLHHAAEPNATPSITPSPDAPSAPHPEPAFPPYDPALASQLLDAAGELTSPGDVNSVLRAVYRAMVEHRLSLKEAGVLCYLAQAILHTHGASAYEQKLQAEAVAKPRERILINDLPMAIRD